MYIQHLWVTWLPGTASNWSWAVNKLTITLQASVVVIVKFIRTQFLVTVWLLSLKELFHSAKWKHAECTTFFESQDWSYYCPVFLYQPVMPDEVNDRVNFLSHNQQELITFANHHSNPIGDHNPDISARTQQCHQWWIEQCKHPMRVHNIKLPGVDLGDDNNDPLNAIFETQGNYQARIQHEWAQYCQAWTSTIN